MPIAIDEFESQPEEILGLGEGTQAYKVLEYLAENPDKAFTPKEISEETSIKKGSIGTVLSRLEDRNLVRHKGKYWAIIEDDRLASFTAMTQGSSASLNDDYFGENE
ncbi:MAG: MarR family transcriptional regulator [Candidatus Aenigmatarchaeota archaeon]